MKVRQAFEEKEYKTISVERPQILHMVEPFIPNVVKKVEPPKQEKKQPVIEKKVSVVKPPPKINENENVSYDINEFSNDELKDPDTITNLISISVLEDRKKILEEKYNQVEGRPPRELREKLMKTRVQLTCMQKGMQDGIITIESYTAKLHLQIAHDRKLAQYFKDKKEDDKSRLVLERVNMMIKELKELA